MKILIVDDYEEGRRVLRKILENYGHEIITAANGAEAIEHALAQPPDIIVSDIMMPEMDGFELFYECKRNKRLNDIPFVFYTAHFISEEDERFAQDMGVDLFIHKPIEPKLLLEKLHEVLEKAGSRSSTKEETTPVKPLIFLQGHKKRIIAKLEKEITERKKIEEELRKSEARYRELVEQMPVLLCRFRPDGTLTFVNKAYQNYFGHGEKSLRGENFFQFIPEKEREYVRKKYFSLDSKKPIITYEHKVYDRNGNIRWMEWTDRALFDENGKITEYQSVGIDVTERKTAEEELRLLATAIEHAAEGVIVTDEKGIIRYVNPAFEADTGYSRREIIGQDGKILKSDKWHEKLFDAISNMIAEGKTWKGRLVNRKKNGALFEVEASVSPVIDSTGKTTNFVIIWRDVTEANLLERRLRESQKLEAIGTLAGGIAHDFNNILSSIIGFTMLAMDQAPKNSQLHADLEKIYKAGVRARELVSQILTFSRQREQEKSPIRIEPIVKESLKLLRASFPSSIEIRQNIAPDLGTIFADPTQIHQVFMNLCTNAAQAMEEKGGILEISLSNVELDSDFAYNHPGVTPGPHVRLTVKDTGRGMEPEVIEHIFEPYFTTKEQTGGTGLGLALVHGIVASHNGTITVQSEPGKGSTFDVYFPVTEKKPVEEIQKSGDSSRGVENILFVDDERDLIEMGKRILEGMGYKVVTKTSSLEALDLFRENPDKFDLVITDLTMPFMSGDELAEELVRIRHDIPVILYTGYGDKISDGKIMKKCIQAYLKKPLLKSELAETIRRVLNGKNKNT